MLEKNRFYIGGQWVDPVVPRPFTVINPANEEPIARISLGSKADVDKAVAAARVAFGTFSRTLPQERRALLQRIVEVFQKRLAGGVFRARSPRSFRSPGTARRSPSADEVASMLPTTPGACRS
jgi:hypothetical protein